MRRRLTGIALAAGFAVLAVAPDAMAQRRSATFLPPSAGDEAFLESWFGAELRSAGLKPLWPASALRGYRERYRLLFAGGSAGVTIVSVDVGEDGSSNVVSTRLRPGGMIEENARARYIPGKIAWADNWSASTGAITRLRRLFDSADFLGRSFRAGSFGAPAAEEPVCIDGINYLIEMHDRRGYNVITRNSCDVDDVRGLVDAVMRLGGGWPRA